MVAETYSSNTSMCGLEGVEDVYEGLWVGEGVGEMMVAEVGGAGPGACSLVFIS